MKRSPKQAFTLVEMLTVMLIIAVITGLVVGVSSLVNKKAALAKADGEIHGMSSALEQFKADFGSYPQNSDTDRLNPKQDFNSAGDKYQKASLVLYEALSGDNVQAIFDDGKNKGGKETVPDGKTDDGEKSYYPFKPSNLGYKKGSNGEKNPAYVQDPFGNSYGYSTAGLKAEENYRDDLKKNAAAVRSEDAEGFNTATFDMWSTAGYVLAKGSSEKTANEEQKRWVKNW